MRGGGSPVLLNGPTTQISCEYDVIGSAKKNDKRNDSDSGRAARSANRKTGETACQRENHCRAFRTSVCGRRNKRRRAVQLVGFAGTFSQSVCDVPASEVGAFT